jgi:protein-tyrosine kinase
MTQVAVIRSPPAEGPLAAGPSSENSFEFSPNLVALLSPLSPSSESIRAIRTHLLAQHVQVGRRALAICATGVGSGATFMATNLAIAAAQAGLQVLLVDADLREPGVQDLIKPAQPVQGLTECLSVPDAQAADYIQQNVLPGLSVLYAGHAALNAQELLATDRFGQTVNACLRDYDLTIIDTPPSNRFADVRRIANVAGYALIVARRNKSFVPDVKVLAEQLQSDNAVVIGTVLNA